MELSQEEQTLVELLKKPSDELDFSVRAANCLANASIDTVGHIVTRNLSEISTMKNFGRKSQNEIKFLLDELGLHLDTILVPAVKAVLEEHYANLGLPSLDSWSDKTHNYQSRKPVVAEPPTKPKIERVAFITQMQKDAETRCGELRKEVEQLRCLRTVLASSLAVSVTENSHEVLRRFFDECYGRPTEELIVKRITKIDACISTLNDMYKAFNQCLAVAQILDAS